MSEQDIETLWLPLSEGEAVELRNHLHMGLNMPPADAIFLARKIDEILRGGAE